MAKEVLHVVPQGDQWAVKREGSDRTSSTHSTQREAIENAQEIAQDGDAIVIHRADGTIRGRFSYSEENDKANRANEGNDRERRERQEVHLQDVASVGTRVSWGAVLAGTVVALAVYVTLMALATAIGITTRERFVDMPREYVITAAVVAVISLLAGLFLGGMVASRTTAGETKLESIIYGVLVWGTFFLFLTVSGANLAGNAAIATGLFANADERARLNWNLTDEQLNRLDLSAEQRQGLKETFNLDRALNNLNLTPEQKQRIQEELNPQRVDPATAAWIGFAAMLLSIIAAIAGAIVGAGPELVLREFRARSRRFGPPRVAVAPAGAPAPTGEKVRA